MRCVYNNNIAALLLALFAGSASLAAAPTALDAAEPSAAPPKPSIEVWLNQKVRLRDTVPAMDRPAADAKSAGEIRAGAEIQAIGMVTGRKWVQVELPDHSLAYVAAAAVEFEGAARPTPKPAEPLRRSEPPERQKPATATVVAPGVIRGAVTGVPNAATLVVAEQRIRLSGIDPGPPRDLPPFESWLRGQGALLCEPDAQTGRYRCFTGAGVDVAEAAILNGAGRVGDGASPAYRDSETAARQGKRGLWGQP